MRWYTLDILHDMALIRWHSLDSTHEMEFERWHSRDGTQESHCIFARKECCSHLSATKVSDGDNVLPISRW